MVMHHFDIEDAAEHGIPAAVLLENMRFWIQHNRANGRHQMEERTWTYNSARALAELFPYLSEDQIQRQMKRLVDSGVILKKTMGNAFDKTNWYAFADEEKYLAYPARLNDSDSADSRSRHSACAPSLPQEHGIHTANLQDLCIDNKQQILNADTKGMARKRAAAASQTLTVADLASEGVDEQQARDWLTLRKAKRLPLTPSAWEAMKAEAGKLGITAADAVSHAVASNWVGFKAAWFNKGQNASQGVRQALDNATENAKAREMLFGSTEVLDG